MTGARVRKLPHREAIGLGGPVFEFDVERGKVHEFARTLFSFHPEYLEGSNPPMFPTQSVVAGYLWGYMLEDPQDTELAKVDIEDSMSLDAEQEFVFPAGPPRAGTRLAVRTWVDDIWEKRGRRSGRITFYRTRSDFVDEHGELSVIQYATSVVPSRVPESVPVESAPPDGERAFMPHGEQRRQFTRIEPAGWRALAEGRGPGAIEMPPLTLTEQVCYQIVSGNYGAGHHDTTAARAEGYRDWFSIGMFHAGLLTTYAVNWLGPSNIRRIKFRFLDMIWPGDRLRYAGRVARTFREHDERRVDIELECLRAGGEGVVVGSATFIVP